MDGGSSPRDGGGESGTPPDGADAGLHQRAAPPLTSTRGLSEQEGHGGKGPRPGLCLLSFHLQTLFSSCTRCPGSGGGTFGLTWGSRGTVLAGGKGGRVWGRRWTADTRQEATPGLRGCMDPAPGPWLDREPSAQTRPPACCPWALGPGPGPGQPAWPGVHCAADPHQGLPGFPLGQPRSPAPPSVLLAPRGPPTPHRAHPSCFSGTCTTFPAAGTPPPLPHAAQGCLSD